jgi:hypothetical protein
VRDWRTQKRSILFKPLSWAAYPFRDSDTLHGGRRDLKGDMIVHIGASWTRAHPSRSRYRFPDGQSLFHLHEPHRSCTFFSSFSPLSMAATIPQLQYIYQHTPRLPPIRPRARESGPTTQGTTGGCKSGGAPSPQPHPRHCVHPVRQASKSRQTLLRRRGAPAAAAALRGELGRR